MAEPSSVSAEDAGGLFEAGWASSMGVAPRLRRGTVRTAGSKRGTDDGKYGLAKTTEGLWMCLSSVLFLPSDGNGKDFAGGQRGNGRTGGLVKSHPKMSLGAVFIVCVVILNYFSISPFLSATMFSTQTDPAVPLPPSETDIDGNELARSIVGSLSDRFDFSFEGALESLVKQGVVSSDIFITADVDEQTFEEDETVVDAPRLDVPRKSSKEETSDDIMDGWYEKGTKYFLFQTSGGLSNQRKILEWGVAVAHLLKRTIILPPVAPHTTLYSNYNKVKWEDMSAMGDIIDLKLLKTFVPAVEIKGMPLIRFVRRFENRTGVWHRLERSDLREKRKDPWESSRVVNLYGNNEADVLFFARGTMWQCFAFTNEEIDLVQTHVRFHPNLRHVARLAALSLNGGVFNALHIRFADGDASKLREGWLRSSSTFLYRMKMAKFRSYSDVLYIATVPTKRKSIFFNKMKSQYRVVFSSDLDKTLFEGILKDYPLRLQSSILGIIEQLLCARAQKFLGTGFSTFSEYIRRVRALRALGADPYVVPGLASEQEIEQEREFLQQDTPCTSETKPC